MKSPKEILATKKIGQKRGLLNLKREISKQLEQKYLGEPVNVSIDISPFKFKEIRLELERDLIGAGWYLLHWVPRQSIKNEELVLLTIDAHVDPS